MHQERDNANQQGKFLLGSFGALTLAAAGAAVLWRSSCSEEQENPATAEPLPTRPNIDPPQASTVASLTPQPVEDTRVALSSVTSPPTLLDPCFEAEKILAQIPRDLAELTLLLTEYKQGAANQPGQEGLDLDLLYEVWDNLPDGTVSQEIKQAQLDVHSARDLLMHAISGEVIDQGVPPFDDTGPRRVEFSRPVGADMKDIVSRELNPDSSEDTSVPVLHDNKNGQAVSIDLSEKNLRAFEMAASEQRGENVVLECKVPVDRLAQFSQALAVSYAHFHPDPEPLRQEAIPAANNAYQLKSEIEENLELMAVALTDLDRLRAECGRELPALPADLIDSLVKVWPKPPPAPGQSAAHNRAVTESEAMAEYFLSWTERELQSRGASNFEDLDSTYAEPFTLQLSDAVRLEELLRHTQIELYGRDYPAADQPPEFRRAR